MIEHIVYGLGILPAGQEIVLLGLPAKYGIEAVAPLPLALPLETPLVVAFRPLPVKSVNVVPLHALAEYRPQGGLLEKRDPNKEVFVFCIIVSLVDVPKFVILVPLSLDASKEYWISKLSVGELNVVVPERVTVVPATFVTVYGTMLYEYNVAPDKPLLSVYVVPVI